MKWSPTFRNRVEEENLAKEPEEPTGGPWIRRKTNEEKHGIQNRIESSAVSNHAVK